jgi:hypothetical protein
MEAFSLHMSILAAHFVGSVFFAAGGAGFAATGVLDLLVVLLLLLVVVVLLLLGFEVLLLELVAELFFLASTGALAGAGSGAAAFAGLVS